MSKKNHSHKQDNPAENETSEQGAEAQAANAAQTENAENAQPQRELSDLEKALAAAEDFKRKWYNVSAEYENYRKRNSAAVANAYRDGASDAVLRILPVADNFGYAYDSASDEKTKAGIDKVIKSFATILAGLGIEEIAISAGDPFDEKVAEAIMNAPAADGEKPNTVKQVLKKGYRAGDRVIRYAQVIVTV